jgi:DNA-binding beta-propeller fold protein YncE
MIKRAIGCGRILLSISAVLIFSQTPAHAQKVEVIDGVRVVHNQKGGRWGDHPAISIKLIRTIGDLDTSDENLAFNGPEDIALDETGNIYILDSRNHRIQKFSSELNYLATFGRRGQGPAEFNYPQSIALDAKGMIYVLDGFQKRIQILTPDGKDRKIITVPKLTLERMRLLKSGALVVKGYLLLGLPGQPKEKTLPKLAKILDLDGNVQREFGDLVDYGDGMTNSLGNAFQLDIDGRDNIYFAFVMQNRVEKYAPDGTLLWRADRELNFPVGVLQKGKMESKSGGVSYEAPRMNHCSSTIAADDKGRVWVATLKRQIKKEEVVSAMMVGGPDGIRSIKAMGNQELQTTDMYKLEIFDSDGVLLGEIPVTHFVDGIRIWKDRLFLLDRDRGARFYEYQIVEE